MDDAMPQPEESSIIKPRKPLTFPSDCRAYCDFPGHVLVRTPNGEFGMDLTCAVQLLRDLRNAIDTAAGSAPL